MHLPSRELTSPDGCQGLIWNFVADARIRAFRAALAIHAITGNLAAIPVRPAPVDAPATVPVAAGGDDGIEPGPFVEEVD